MSTGPAAALLGPDWVWPWWLERQLDPRSPAFVPVGGPSFPANVTARNWTTIGNLASRWKAVVDPRGLVTPWLDGWSLDWWIGADDRWHVPSRETGVRQRLIDAAPVVETAMRVPGGDALHRAYAVRATAADGGEELVVVEIENRSRLPFAVALAVRPYNPKGLAAIERIALQDTAVMVDGRVAMLLPKVPARVAASTFDLGDSAVTVMGGGASSTFPDGLRCEAGMAQAAFVFPLAHTATIRVVLPLALSKPARHRRVERAPAYPAGLPSAGQVAAGWGAQTRRGMRLELPDERLAEAVDASRRFVLLSHDGAEHEMLLALDRYGFHREVAEVLVPSSGAALWALAEHWRLTRDRELLSPMVGAIAKAVHRIERKGGADFWDVAGMTAGADLLTALGQPEAADAARRFASSLAACEPLRIDAVAERCCVGDAYFDSVGHTGLSPHLTLQLASVELAMGNRRALDRMTWLLDAATTTWTWPEAIHPRLPGGSAGEGHHGPTAAALLSFVLTMLVREVQDGLALCSMLPTPWLGQAVGVHDAPTHHGQLSFAVRWHGDRPALLWELVRHPDHDGRPVRLTAPGLDPSWSSIEPTGDALLAPAAAASFG